MLCLCFFKKHADVKLRAEEKVEISGSYDLFLILVPEFWGLGFFSCLLPSFPKSFSSETCHHALSLEYCKIPQCHRENTFKREGTEMLSIAFEVYPLPG